MKEILLFDIKSFNIKVVLVYISLSRKKDELNCDFQEFSSLATSIGMKITNVLIIKNLIFRAKYCIGIGKVLELERMVKSNLASIVLFNHVLSSFQERNLASFLKCKVMDRNQLILNIFSQRARTYAGKLQVNLAHLRYLNSRLTHEWNHLERQKGGIGLRGGPGEMQLENDRRIVRKKINRILLHLRKIENQREQSRKNRSKMGSSIISLVGYTNAGKSTLFNAMTTANVYTSEKLFATLDPTFRRIIYKGASQAILIDTVGFIQNLPDDLIFSFQTTLKETMESTLLIHVVDASNKRFEQNINTVHTILNSMNIKNIPIILVMNKIDKFKKILPHIDRDENGYPIRVWISAQNNLGISLLMQVLNELLSNDIVNYELKLPINHDLCQKLYQLRVVQQYLVEDDWNVRIKIHSSLIVWNRLLKENKSLINYII